MRPRPRPPHRPALVALTVLALAACGDGGGVATDDTVTAGATPPGPATDPTGTTSPASEPASTGTSGPQPTTTGTDPLTTDPATPGTTDATTAPPGCEPGTILCDGDTAQVCDGQGGFAREEACPNGCAPGVGCRACVPGEGACDGQVAHQCDAEGSGFVDIVCDDLQGVTCEAGRCVGACAPATLGTSYIGCDYYSVVTLNAVSTDFTFAVVVSNVSAEDADVTITRGDDLVVDILVPAGTVEVVPLPWVPELKFSVPSALVADGAYRVRSTRPVTLYQYNPLEYTKDQDFSYSNDASLLMPTNVWGRDTLAIGRNTHAGNAGLYAVVAREDATQVTLTPGTSGKFVKAGAGVAADGSGVVVLDAGDVLQVLSAVGAGDPDISDVTGTRVVSDRPVMVLGGQYCPFFPADQCCCDHLEELNLPVDNLAREYLVSTPLVKAPNMDPILKARMVRVVATADATTLTYDPPQPGAPAMLAQAGDYGEIQTDQDFKITASAKIAVSEYLLSQAAGGDTGDPAMTIAVPTEQYRTSYAFHAPTHYESSFVNITAPSGSDITLDGQPVAGFVAIGATGYDVARVQLSSAGDGDHVVTGDAPFGVQVYGYGQYTSYWYPGGLDLKLIPQ